MGKVSRVPIRIPDIFDPFAIPRSLLPPIMVIKNLFPIKGDILGRNRQVVKTIAREIFRDSIALKQRFLLENLDVLDKAVHALAGVVGRGNKILLFGNGGSAADAQHIAAEFVNRYMIDRPPLPAMALTTDSSVLTSISNDFGFEEVFEKQIRALGENGDAAVGISTSGRSPNVVRGLKTAREIGLVTIGLGGPAGTLMEEHCDYYFRVEGASTPRIQEVHQLVGHTLVAIVEQILFGTHK